MRMLTSLSIDEILLPRYVNWSIDLRGLLFDEEMAPLFKAFELFYAYVDIAFNRRDIATEICELVY